MAIVLQLIVLAVSLFGTAFLAVVLETGFFQQPIHAAEVLGDKPLPLLTITLSENHGVIGYGLFALWLGFAALPLFYPDRKYFDVELFLLRSAAFLTILGVVTLVLAIFLLIPFMPYYPLMDTSKQTVAEWMAAAGFWGFLLLVVCLVGKRWKQNRNRVREK